MKIIKLTLVLLCMSFFALAQDSAEEQKTFDGIAKAVKAGQSSDLAVYLASSIECDLLGKDEVYSKPQATQVMKDFFSKNKPKNFTTLHKSGKGQVKYIIGNYTTTAGENYRMTFFVKQEGNKYLVQQIRVEKGSAD